MADLLITLSLSGAVTGIGAHLYRTSPYNRTRLNRLAVERIMAR